jgi:uncharacterized protein YdbL (DUF1318 family)
MTREVNMKTRIRSFRTIFFLAILLPIACVTINIYFPAEKVESVAEEIVEDIRGLKSEDNKKPEQKDQGRLFDEPLYALLASVAWADDVTTVSNPTIRALKERMRARFAQMKPYFQQGKVKEGNDGYVSLGNVGGLDLKTRRNLKTLVDAENKDRQSLYKEVARALKIDPAQINKIGAIFAKEWKKSLR